jgi:hypothetical protein
VAGDTAQAQDLANQRRDAFEDDKSQTTVERLRAMAEAWTKAPTSSLGPTARPILPAGHAWPMRRGRRARQQGHAGTMRNLAQCH